MVDGGKLGILVDKGPRCRKRSLGDNQIEHSPPKWKNASFPNEAHSVYQMVFTKMDFTKSSLLKAVYQTVCGALPFVDL